MAKAPAAAAGYSGTPLPKKLGIRADWVVALVDAPEGFESVLGDLPPGVELRRDLRKVPRLAVFFARDLRACKRMLSTLDAALASGAGAWVAWPKKSSPLARDLDENLIRAEVLARGLVDIKVCAVDATWSGLRIARRRAGTSDAAKRRL